MENLPATLSPEKRRGLVHASPWPLLASRTWSKLDSRKIKQLISWLSSAAHEHTATFPYALSWGQHEKSFCLRRARELQCPVVALQLWRLKRELPDTGWNSYCPSVLFSTAEVSSIKIWFFLPQAEMLNQRLAEMFLHHWQRFKAASKGSQHRNLGTRSSEIFMRLPSRNAYMPNSYTFQQPKVWHSEYTIVWNTSLLPQFPHYVSRTALIGTLTGFHLLFLSRYLWKVWEQVYADQTQSDQNRLRDWPLCL